MTSAPPMTNTSLPPAASGRWVTMKNGMPNGFRPLHASAASYVFRPPTTAPPRATAPSRNSRSAPVASPVGSSS